jgi:hypothetical protein
MTDILDGKTESEIRRAASFWFIAQEAYCRGEDVPLGIFIVSAKDATEADVAWAEKLIAEHPEWKDAEYFEALRQRAVRVATT